MTEFPVSVDCPVLWGDLDALGHVNNTQYFRWFEEARITFFERSRLVDRGTPGVGPILAHTECDFLVPVTYPATITSYARTASIGRTSFTMEYRVDLVGGRPVASGNGVVVMLDYSSGERVPISDELRERLAAFG